MADRVIQFLKVTSIKGIPRIFRTKSYFLKTVWGISVICFISMAAYQVTLLSKAYLEYNSVISLTEHPVDLSGQTPHAIRFPDITFCNLNPFAVSTHNLKHIPSLESYHNLVKDKTSCVNCSEQQLKSLRELRVQLLTTSGYYIHIGAAKARKISHSENQFIASCTVGMFSGMHPRKVPCEGVATIVPFYDDTHYNCYTVKMPPATPEDMYGAVIMVFHLNNYQKIIEQQKFLTPHFIPGQMNGALMVLHEPNNLPIIMRDAIHLPAGQFMSTKLNFIETTRLPEPYGNCIPNYEMKENYQQIICYSACVQSSVLRYCGCVDYTSYNEFLNLSTTSDVPPCLSVKVSSRKLHEKWECVKNIRLNATAHCFASCPTPCEELVYIHDVRILLWYAYKGPISI